MEITRMCNLNCVHCFEKTNLCLNEEMSDQTVLELAYQIKRIVPVSFCICGGEPALRLPLVESVIDILGEVNINTSMVTNGTLLTKEDYIGLKEHGLKTVQISIDGLRKTHDYVRQRAGSFDKAIKAVEDSMDAGLGVNLSFTCMNYNIGEFEDFICLIQPYLKMGLKVTVAPIVAEGNALQRKDIIPKWDSYRKIVETINKENRKYGTEVLTWTDSYSTDALYSETMVYENQLYINNKGEVVSSPYYGSYSIKMDRSENLLEAWRNKNIYIKQHEHHKLQGL